jgi:hypothetical protein
MPPEPHQRQRLRHAGIGLGAGRGREIERQAHVLLHPRPGHEGCVLEHHHQLASGLADALEALAPPAQPPVGRRDQVGDHLEEGRLAAARWPEQRDELARPDAQVDRVERPGAVGVDLVGRQHLDDGRRVGGYGHCSQDGPSPDYGMTRRSFTNWVVNACR